MHTSTLFAAITLSVATLASTGTTAATAEDPRAMAECNTDADCAVVAQLCNGWTAVNKDSEGSWQAYRIKMMPVISCPVAQNIPKPSSTQCIHNTCRVK